MDLKTAIPFFRLPLEIRRAVYSHLINAAGFHIVPNASKEGRPRLLPCLGPDLYAHSDGMDRRSGAGYNIRDPVWIRRLASTWGPHWRCEEEARADAGRRREIEHATLLRVCKQTHLELGEFITEAVFFHVTDLRSLVGPNTSAPASGSFDTWGSSIPRHLKKLSITQFFPLAFYQALATGEEAPLTLDFEKDLLAWSSISSCLFSLTELAHVRIWLDHHDQEPWSHVSERAILSPFDSIQARNPDLDIVIILPKLDPRFTDPDRHYVKGADTSLTIRRTFRQRYRVRREDGGSPLVRYSPDFPRSYGHPAFADMTLAQKEEFEEKLWAAGEDVDQLLAALVR